MNDRRSLSAIMAMFAAMLLVLAPTAALAESADTGSGSTQWTGQGMDSIDEECPPGTEPHLHWILTPGGPFDLSNAVLTVEGDTYQGTWRSDTGEHGAVHFDTDYYEGAEEGDLDASVTFDWERRSAGGPDEPNAQLVISDGCPAEPEPEPQVTVVFEKVWSVEGDDDLFDATEVDASLIVDGDAVHFGTTIDVTHKQGDTLVVEEHVDETTLPEECTWEGSDLDTLDLTVPTADEQDIHHEITITNEITCVLDEVIDRVDDVEVEVLDRVEEAEVRGAVRQLPVTGATIPGLLLAGLASLMAGGLMTRRRR